MKPGISLVSRLGEEIPGFFVSTAQKAEPAAYAKGISNKGVSYV
jgi:hypothetical protein